METPPPDRPGNSGSSGSSADGHDDATGSTGPFLQARTVRLLLAALAGIALGVTLLRLGYIPTGMPVPAGWVATAAGAASSAVIAYLVGLRGYWPLGAALGPPVAALALLSNIPGWVFPLLIIVLAGLFWNVRTERVPLYLTNMTTQKALADLVQDIPEAFGGRIIDLGCGFGRTTLTLARQFPGAKVTGVETAPLVFAIAFLRVKMTGPANASIAYRNLWDEDLGLYGAVYCFLSTAPMARLIAKARKEMRPGTVLVSNTFTDPGDTSDEVVLVGDSRETQLHVWRF